MQAMTCPSGTYDGDLTAHPVTHQWAIWDERDPLYWAKGEPERRHAARCAAMILQPELDNVEPGHPLYGAALSGPYFTPVKL